MCEQSTNHISLKIDLDVTVTHCIGRVSANARPRQLHCSDWEMETATYLMHIMQSGGWAYPKDW